MAKLRFIGDAPRIVVCNGHPRGGNLGIVEPDQVLEVADEVYLAHQWPETVWSEVDVPDRPADEELSPEDEALERRTGTWVDPTVVESKPDKPAAKPPASPPAPAAGKPSTASEKE